MGKSKKTYHKYDINKTLAKVLVLHRVWHGYTQKQIAQCIHVSFQQIQKYERCINRLPGDHLVDICKQKKWDISLFTVDNPHEILNEWINNVDQLSNPDSPYPLRIDQIQTPWDKIEDVGIQNYLHESNPRYKSIMEERI
jgi:transcriptional regulator with XRE-family HTH domain